MSETNGSKYGPVLGKVPGTRVNLAGRELILAPLNLDSVQELEALQKAVDEGGMHAGLKAAIPMIHKSLLRNYADITEADVRALVDFGNFQACCEAISSISGMKEVPSGELPPASP